MTLEVILAAITALNTAFTGAIWFKLGSLSGEAKGFWERMSDLKDRISNIEKQLQERRP